MLSRVFTKLVLCAVAQAATLCTVTPDSLRLEHNVAAGADLGFTDVLTPRFSWQLHAADEHGTPTGTAACRGSLQQAFRLRVSRTHDGTVVVDTGELLSSVSLFVAPHAFLDVAPALDADTSYTVQVETWGSVHSDDATPSTVPGSATAHFHTALRANELADWEGSWIGGFTQLRASFALPVGKAIASAAAYASGIGCFELTLNGALAADDVALEPGFSTVPTVRQLYRAYDVTALLRSGEENAVGFRLGMCKYGYLGSFCSGAHASTAACRAAILQLNIKFEDGTQFNVSTNAGGAWTGTTDANPVRYTHLFHGESFDARLLEPFDEPGFSPSNLSAWAPVLKYDTSIDGIGELSLHTAPPIAVTERFVPITVTEVQPPSPPPSPRSPSYRSFIFDMGQNFAGVVSFDFRSAGMKSDMPAGTTLTLRHAELLHEDGSLYNSYCGFPICNCGGDGGNCANQTDQYIASGIEVEVGAVWKPRFTYHGFRFVQLDGWPFADSDPALGTLTGLLTASAVPPLGQVHFSDPSMEILNSIQTMILYTQRSNLHSIPTDCPHREKRGWMGDAQWTAGQAALNFDMAALYANFVRSMGDTQEVECNQVADKVDGTLTEHFTAAPRRPPTYECCSKAHPTFGCDWTGTNFTDVMGSLPDVVPYSKKTYGGWPGDPTWGVAAAVIPWEVYARTGDVSNLASAYPVAKAFVDFLSRHESPDSGLVEFGYYGDWLQLEQTATPAVTGWSHILGVARLADMAAAVGKTDDAAQYSAKLASLKAIYHAKYFNTEAGTYGSSQTANLLPLYLNITPPAEVPSVAAALAASLQKRNLGLSSGGMGTRYVFQALAQNGYAPLALDVATATTQPSLGYMALQGPAGGGLGAGTVWENWGGNAHDYGGGSKNHPMFTGGIGIFLYNLAGIGHDMMENADPMRVVFRPGAGDATVARRVGAASVSLSTPVGVARLAWRYEQGGSSQFTANVTVPVGLRQPAELHVHFGAGGGDDCGVLEFVDLSRGTMAAQLLPGQKSGTAELSPGITLAAMDTTEAKLEMHMLSGEFAFVVRRSLTACLV